MDQDPQTTAAQPGSQPAGRSRRFGATRVRPRVEFGKPTPPAATADSTTPEVVEAEPLGGLPNDGMDSQFGGGGDPFGPRSFAGGRVRVYGCSPGCLVASVLISLLLTILLNALF